jgi:hypothetical protein
MANIEDDEEDKWFGKMVRQVQSRPPTCLAGFRVTPLIDDEWEECARFAIACSCGGTKGKLLGHPLSSCNPEYAGSPCYVSPLAVQCGSCGRTTELIDTKIHGYNAEISKLDDGIGDSNYRGSGDRAIVTCPECGGNEFSFTVHFGHSHFDLIQDEPELEPRAQEFMDGFDCRGLCTSCGAEASRANFELA